MSTFWQAFLVTYSIGITLLFAAFCARSVYLKYRLSRRWQKRDALGRFAA